MRTINRSISAALALISIVATASCSSGAVPTADIDAPLEGPRYDGGITFGSGNVIGLPPQGTENTTAADTGSAARGGITFGSGN